MIGLGSNERKLTPPDDVCQVSDESALSIYERGPKVSSWSSRSLRLHMTFTSVYIRFCRRPRVQSGFGLMILTVVTVKAGPSFSRHF